MKKVIILIISVILLSCSQQEIKLPKLATKGVQEIYDHSQVWIFFEVKEGDTIANLNRKNTISSTHWIYNIDNRLPLKSFISSIINLQDKHANGIHSKEGMHNYYSYADTISKKLSFFEFDKTVYKTDSLLSKYEIKTNSELYKSYNNINLTFNPENTWINDAKMENGELKNTLIDFIDFSAEGKKTMLHLNFNQNLSYQNYLFYRTLIETIQNTNISINQFEYIFDPNKVPDCGCQ
ncbi:hypothetical protein EC396_04910 [Lutibacter sp. HS1-25]|uniref:hypothetical protein n=1 Tax=Lutibacter sp. HS1-25 TaxID=2485000 RepID=UPI001011EE0F|nr:hypothetical protein [Lutibacter sp. HS1-25]RXP60358.1 hypothetical protein EC396_04910 [Lutibacter sp. HS1-25]